MLKIKYSIYAMHQNAIIYHNSDTKQKNTGRKTCIRCTPIINHNPSLYIYPGEVTPCQIKNHVQRKFATPILYAIDIFLNYDIFFNMYKTIDNIFCIFFWNF